MRKLIQILATTTALTAAFPAFAQDGSAQVATVSDDIIVTARRGDERLQDVPVSVQAISGSQLQKLAITTADELSKVAPGLTLVNQGASTAVVLRGVTWQPGSGTPATPIYFNEIPFDPQTTLQSIYDVGQVEVLRGPQGTSRGAPSISGAVTIVTRKPDLEEFGGYVQGLYGSASHTDLQGAINVPVIKGVLAVRLAANIEDGDGLRVYSVNSTIQPKLKDRSFRATVLFKPTDNLSVQAMYQRRKTDRLNYTQVAGTGSPGLAALGIPARFNGPALTVGDRASVQDAPGIENQHVDHLTVNAAWDIFGQKLTYNYGRQFTRSPASFATADPLNILPGFEPYTSPRNVGLPNFRTHEVRLSSAADSGLPFDYDIGWFSKHSGGTINFSAPVYYLPGTIGGAFGAPGTLPGVVKTPDSRYVLNSSTNIALGQAFDSFYGNVRLHLGDKTELSGGIALIKDRVPVQLDVTTFAARAIAAPLTALGGLPCPGIPGVFVTGLVNSVYAGYCDALIPAGVGNSTESHNDKYKDTLYNFSLSHKFSDDILVYATTGSSFRTGLPAINNTGLPSNLLVPKPETAKSYELGVKTSFGRKLRVNAAVFQLDYKDQLTTFEGVSYFNAVTGNVAQTSLAFYRNIDAKVRGFELEIAAEPVDNLTLGANLSYSQIKSQGGNVPCNNPAVAINAANPINTCASPKGQVLNTTAPFQATINGGYSLPLAGSFDGYFRFNLNYQGNNQNYGNFRTGGAFKQTPAYAVLDLYAGLTGGEGAWDLGFYAKNVFDKQVELGRVATLNTVYPLFAAPSGYDVVRTSLPREIGVTLRYAFGSR